MKTKFLTLCFAAIGFMLMVLGTNQAIANVNVTFQVKMNIKLLEGTFKPGSGDIVKVNGTFNNWDSSTDTLKDLDGDTVYTKTVPLTMFVGDTIYYKFWKTSRGGINYEAAERVHIIASVDDTIPAPFFDQDSVFTTPLNVTFQVKMNIKMREGTFKPSAGDIVSVNGDFNGWTSAVDTMKDLNGDSVYSGTVSMPRLIGDSITYKFWKTTRGGINWESDPNRRYGIASANDTVPAVYFDRDSVYTPPIPAPVTFQVNMRVKMLEGSFLPGSGDIVRVAGNFNGWGNSKDTLTDPDHDSVYTKTVANDTLYQNTTVLYKYLKTPRAGLDWEGDPNRSYDVPTGGGTVPVVYFDRDTTVNLLVTANVLWQVDMTTYEDLGWFRPDLGDTMQIRGPFNGWGGSKMDQSFINPGLYQLTFPAQGPPTSDVGYKYFMQFESTAAAARFPGYATATRDGIAYDHPATRGDGNRIINIGNGGDFTTDLAYFSDINPKGEIPAGDTVTVTVTGNMGPATRYLTALNPATDTVRLIFQDQLSRAAQVKIQGSFPDLDMSHSSPTDTFYTVSFNIIGPAHYGMQYTYRYVQPGGFAVNQGGGLGNQNLFISRFIQPLAFGKTSKTATTWPRNYSTPVDLWQQTTPLPHETPPFDIINGVSPEKPTGRPVAYRLFQNYPNPFNPATQIRYALPERAHVSLKVYNLLGQEMATLVNQDQAAGNYIALFEANKLPSGVYFYKLQAGKFLDVKKALLIR
jgi:type IX secretion system substrate protein